MTPLFSRRALARGSGSERSGAPLSLNQWVEMFKWGGMNYPILANQTMVQSAKESPEGYAGYIESAYKQNGVVFACMMVRMLLFSEARFRFRREVNGRPGDLFGAPGLAPLERPWTNGTTGDLLMRMIQDADLCGNAYVVRDAPAKRGGDPTLRRMRPDWTYIAMASRLGPDSPNWQRDAEVVGYIYQPGGPASRETPQVLLPEQVCHFAPIPDPSAHYRGMSWLTPVIGEVLGDSAAMEHKLKFFENGATPNLTVVLPADIQRKAFNDWVEAFDQEFTGLDNAYKTLFFGAGADVKVIGADMKQIDFKTVQGHGETRIAAAAGVPPIIVGLSEGLESATYSNYGQARRRFVDGTMRPLWRNVAASLERIIDVPGPAGAFLWYDDRDIPFLAEDIKDQADALAVEATTLKTLLDSGWEADAALSAVTSGDLGRLQGKHTGMMSVQLLPPGDATPADPAATPAAAPKLPAAKVNGKPQKALPAPPPK